MAKNLNLSILLDFYGEMLTEKQREVMDFYYNEDLSLAEIAQHSKITRQGVRDSIKRGEVQLLELEEKLGLAAKFDIIQNTMENIISQAKDIQFLNDKYGQNPEIYNKVSKIIAEASVLQD